MSVWFTDATIAFVKETLANLEKVKKENAILEEQLHYYECKRNQCDIAIEKLSDELRKSMYISIDPDDGMQKPVLIDEAFRLLCKKVNDYTEFLKIGKKREEVCSDLLAELTRAYPGVLDEIKD